MDNQLLGVLFALESLFPSFCCQVAVPFYLPNKCHLPWEFSVILHHLIKMSVSKSQFLVFPDLYDLHTSVGILNYCSLVQCLHTSVG